jgi:adenosylcobinamide-GDP ribazoletransferase
MSGLLAAFQFLTLLPVKRNFTAEQIGRSTVYFPIVGVVIGLILAGVNYGLSFILPAAVVNVLLIALLAVLSGALHLDGLADTLDGLAGHRTAEQRLAIMRDSRIGGFGAIGVALFLLIEYVSLNAVPADLKLYILILAPTLSRWLMVNSIFLYPYARPAGLGKAYKDAVGWRQFALATAITLILAVGLLRGAGAVIMAGVWIITTLSALYCKHQLSGLTGDTYGAVNELATAGAFLLVVLLAFNHWLI